MTEALLVMPNIKELLLPSSIIGVDDLDVLRTPLPTANTTESTVSAEMFADITLRRAAITKTATAERFAIEKVGQLATNLSSMSFIRHAFPNDMTEYAVSYRVHIGAPRVIGEWSRPGKVQVVDVQVNDARVGQGCARPTVLRESHRGVLRPISGMVMLAREHQGLAILAAGAGAYACVRLTQA